MTSSYLPVSADHAVETEPLLPSASEHGSSILTETEEATAYELSFKTEARVLLRYSGPLVVTYLLQYGYQLVVVLVASQLSTDELAGVSLGITTSNIVGYALFEGMATALDAYGASRLTDVGLHTIRFTVFAHLVAIPIALFWLFAEQFVHLVQIPSEELARNAGSFLRFSLPGIPGYIAFEAGKRFMQAQGNFNAGFYVLLICLPVNIGLTWLLVYTANMRVSGAALAAAITNLLRPILLVLYATFINRSFLKCWPHSQEIAARWRKEWKIMIKLAVPGAVMTLGEWICFEILTFCTGYIGTSSLAAQTFLSTTATLIWHIPFSASIACSTRVGQLFGAGYFGSMAKLMKWYAVVFAFIGILNCGLGVALTILLLQYIVKDPKVAAVVKIALPYMAGFVIFDASSQWPHSIVRGIGWQSMGAWVTVLVNYVYAVPMAIFLELGPPYLGIRGLWIGLGSGLFLITSIEAFIVRRRLKNGLQAVADAIDEFNEADEETM